RAIGDGLRPTKAGLGQKVVQPRGATADEMREDLPLLAPRQIGTGRGRGEIELRGVAKLPRHWGRSSSLGAKSPSPGTPIRAAGASGEAQSGRPEYHGDSVCRSSETRRAGAAEATWLNRRGPHAPRRSGKAPAGRPLS